MPPPAQTQTLLSPAELSYIHSSLSLTPPIRPDLRSATQFRPLVAETGILPSTNGSARVCYSDGTEAIVGVKAELEKTPRQWRNEAETVDVAMREEEPSDNDEHAQPPPPSITVSLDVPGFREDDALPTFLSSMLLEALLSAPTLRRKLHINARWRWHLYVDILLLSAPLSYPLPLLSLTTHLALLDVALPRLTSEPADDPLFDDDWAAAVPLYAANKGRRRSCPPVTLLVMTVGANAVFDPSREELAVAESVLAVSFAPRAGEGAGLELLALRTVDPPSRLTPPGVPDAANPATAAGAAAAGAGGLAQEVVVTEREKGSVWTPPRGGMKRGLVKEIVDAVLRPGGVGEEVLEGLAGVEM